MSVTVTGKNYLELSNCESSSDGGTWLVLTTQDADNVKQGSYSLCGICKTNGTNDVTFTPSGSKNLENKHVRFWLILTQGKLLDLYANGGIQFWCTGGGVTGYWYVGGRDTYPGGWHNFVVDLSKAVDAGTKPDSAGMQAITAMGIRLVLGLGVKNAVNTWIDCLNACDGLNVYGDFDTGLITCNVNATAGTYTRTAGGSGSFIIDGFKVNQNFTASGFTNDGNNVTKTISTLTATVITVTDKTGLVNETGNADERIRGYFDFEDIFTITNTPATGGLGILTKKAGIYCLTGSMEFGKTDSLTRFQAKSQVIVFENRPNKDGTLSNINSTLMNFTVVDSGNASYTTEFNLGNKSGTQGIEGCVIRVQNTNQIAKFNIDASSANVDNFRLCGSIFLDANSISFPANATNVEILNCNFESCGEILVSTAVVTNCNFISPNNRAIRISSTSHNTTYCNFISCTRAVHINLAETYSFNALMFSGNTYDIENSTNGGAVYINRTNNSNPSQAKVENSGTPPGTTTINPLSVYLTVWTRNEANQVIGGASVAIYKTSDNSELMLKLTDSTGDYIGRAQTTFQYTSDVPIYIRVRKSSTTPRYFPINTTGNIDGNGFTLNVILIKDDIAS